MSEQMSDYHRMERAAFRRRFETACESALDKTRPEYAEIMAAIELLADATCQAVERECAKLDAHREMVEGDL